MMANSCRKLLVRAPWRFKRIFASTSSRPSPVSESFTPPGCSFLKITHFMVSVKLIIFVSATKTIPFQLPLVVIAFLCDAMDYTPRGRHVCQIALLFLYTCPTGA